MSLEAIMRTKYIKFRVTKCKSKNKKRNCVFYASAKNKHLILDCDEIHKHENHTGKSNDCIFFEQNTTLYVGIVEIKGDSYDPREVKSQLLAGARLAENILKISRCTEYEMFLILVCTNFSNRSKLNMIQSMSIPIGNKTLPIRTSKCQKRFSDIIASQ